MQAPLGLSGEEVQRTFDLSYYSPKASSRVKRRYDTGKFDEEFGDGGVLWSALISSVCLLFCRYLYIEDAWIPDIINKAAGKEVDTNQKGYLKAHSRCLQWRKNWFSLYFMEVDILQRRLQDENRGYQALTGNELREAYASHFSYENFFALMGTSRAVVDWRATLEDKNMNALYKTIFTYSLV